MNFLIWKFRSIILISLLFFAEVVKSTAFCTVMLLLQKGWNTWVTFLHQTATQTCQHVGWFEIGLSNHLHTAWFFVKCKCPNSYSVVVRFCVGWKLASGGRNTNTINACICDVPRRYVCTMMHSHTYLVWKTSRLNVYIYSGLFWGENWPKNGTGKNVWFIGYVVDYKQTLHFGSVILYQHVHEK